MNIYEKQNYYQTYLDEKKVSLINHYDISMLEKHLDFSVPWRGITKWAEENKDKALFKSLEPIRPFIPDDSMRQSVMAQWTGYNEHNTQERNWGLEPEDNHALKLMIGRDAFHKLNLDMETCMVRLLQYNPGQVLPLHTDSYNAFKHMYGEGKITRWFVAVTPWDWGHILQIHDNVISNYDSGYAVEIKEGVFHLSANVGINSKYTFTITGFIRD